MCLVASSVPAISLAFFECEVVSFGDKFLSHDVRINAEHERVSHIARFGQVATVLNQQLSLCQEIIEFRGLVRSALCFGDGSSKVCGWTGVSHALRIASSIRRVFVLHSSSSKC